MSAPNQTRRPRIAFVSQADPHDLRAWSGSIYHMRRGLEAVGCEVHAVGPLTVPYRGYLRAKRLLLMVTGRRNHLFDREPFVLRSWARQVEASLKGVAHDFVLSPSSLPLAMLESPKPLGFWTDACFAGMVDYFEPMSRLSRSNLLDGHKAEQAALARCKLAVYSSDWAARGARDAYQDPDRKIHVIPFGANLESERTPGEIRQILASRPRKPFRLLFIGVDWQRKGGDLAVRLVERLNRDGLSCELDVVGCTPPHAMPSHVHLHGFLSKGDPSDAAKLDRLFRSASFFVLPSLAECFGVVFAEAASYGVPSLARQTGGIPDAVIKDGNGMTFPFDADVGPYADWIRESLSSPEHYESLALRAYETQRTRLNWRRSSEQLLSLIEPLL